MKLKVAFLTLLIVPLFASANTITLEYIKNDNETIEEVTKKFAEMYDVPIESVWIWDYENSPKNFLYVRVPDKEFKQPEENTSTSKDLESKVLFLEAENSQLKIQIALLKQIIALLNTLVGLKQ